MEKNWMNCLFMNGRDDPEQRNERWVEIGIYGKIYR